MKSQIKKLEISYFLICSSVEKRGTSACIVEQPIYLFFNTHSALTSGQVHYKISFNRKESIFYNAKLQHAVHFFNRMISLHSILMISW